MGDLQCSFLAFCDFCQRGSSMCSDKTLRKICMDCNIYTESFNDSKVDIQFRKHTGNSKRNVDYEGFLDFINGAFSDAYSCAYKISKTAAIEELKSKIAAGWPQLNNTTEVDCEEGLERLCDVKLYTGIHRARFDPETGKGLGKDGSEDDAICSGYVNGYTNMGTYDLTHSYTSPLKKQCQ
ncbi:Tubulin polymerization-promoting protein family member 3 [Echinococcus granulosus]|uniref:Tubulin polymerization promoting protein family n=1 Tax=Echinococcus granulosus TaxID=6210 RepID=A0A068WSN7_ECHGR|nr:Tubulin polymerization-promoting protein family member 3 [Echinococcus granulosus]CDS23171.1 tubulin polymerization promoting protein family [Echinococcus granulosus]